MALKVSAGSLSTCRGPQRVASGHALPVSSFRPCLRAAPCQHSTVHHTSPAARGRQVVRAAAQEPEEEPEMAQDAITLGLKLSNAGQWEAALEMYERALTLPGTGIKRYRDKPRQASDRERMTALYNIACCHSQLNDVRSGLVALAGCLELGYADFPQIRRDPDLELLRKDPRFEGLLKRFEPSGASSLLGFDLGNIFGRK